MLQSGKLNNYNMINYSKEEIREIQKLFIDALKEEGLVCVPDHVAKYAVNFYEKQRQMLTRVMVTPYEIVKWDLLNGVKSIKTVKNMVKDCRIGVKEHHYVNDKLHILTEAIKRINKK